MTWCDRASIETTGENKLNTRMSMIICDKCDRILHSETSRPDVVRRGAATPMRRSLGDVSPRCRSRRGPGLLARSSRPAAVLGARRPQVVEGTLSALIGLARRGCSGGSALSRGAPERVFALPGATAAPLRVRGPAAAAAATVRRALERARPAHGARAPAHVCLLRSPSRRPIRPLLVLAGAPLSHAA